MEFFTRSFKRTRKYTRYHQDHKLVKEVLEFFKLHPKRDYILRDVAAKTGIDENVLCKWRSAFEKDNSYVPGGKKGYHRRRFTNVQERAIADFLRIQYVRTGTIVRRKHLRVIFFDLWKSFDQENRANVKHNFFSYHFITNFCKRNGFSFRQMRKKKRTDIDEDDVDRYAHEYAEIFANFPWNRILNMDETSWQYVFYRGQTLAEKGSEEVDAQLPDDYRLTFTAIATITADGGKLPPVFLATGKTNACHKQFDGMTSDPTSYEIFHSPGGNTDDETMIFYLKKVNSWMKGQPCALILDKYASHVSESTLAAAEELKIRLVFIPTSATDMFQPLDIRIFGALKAMASSKFDDHVFKYNRGFSKAEAADLFIKCWEKLSHNLIVSAWTYCEEDESDESSDDSNQSDSDFKEYDSDYYSDRSADDEEDIEKIPETELRLLKRENKTPRLTPPRPRPMLN